MSQEKILDSEQQIELSGNAKLAKYNFGISVLLFASFILIALTRILSWDIGLNKDLINQVLSFLFLISTISGFGFSMRSILKKEPKSTTQVICIIGNIIFFLIFIILMITLISDISKLM